MEPPLPPLAFAEGPLSVQRVAAAELLRIHRADRPPIHFGRERWHRITTCKKGVETFRLSITFRTCQGFKPMPDQNLLTLALCSVLAQ